MKKTLCHLALAGIMATALLPLGIAQDTQSPKQDMKDAGHDTKAAAKKTGRATKKGTKKVVHKTAQKTSEGANKVEDKTQPQ